MKKLSLERRRFLLSKIEKEIHRHRKKRGKLAKLTSLKEKRRRASARVRTNSIIVEAPEAFIVRRVEDRQRFLNFLEKVDAHLQKGRQVHLELKNLKELHPCGTLIFLAKLEIWCAVYPGKVTGTYPGDEVAEQLLQHVGALTQLGLASRLQITSEKVAPWHFHSGDQVAASAYADLTTAVLGSNIDHPEKILFADCLNEAVSNSVGHAYKFSVPHTPPVAQRKWWIFSTSREDYIFVSIYDCGVTIPASLRTKDKWKEFLKSRTFWKDSRLLRAAALTETTSTKLPHRGKGLPEMIEFSQHLSSGGLSIMSGRAVLTYQAEGNVTRHMNMREYIPGTLVLWHIPFHKERNDE